MWKFIIVSCVVIGVASTAAPKCCDTGSVVLKKSFECWNPKQNISANITGVSCTNKMKFIKYSVNSDSTLVIYLGADRNTTIENDRYCLANRTTSSDVELKNVSELAIVCLGEEKKIVSDELSGYCLLVSVVFLFLTAVIYVLLPELWDLQGKSVIALCITLGLGLMVLAIMKLISYSDMTLCAVRGFLAYFFILSSFFWTNAISVQILLCVSRPTTGNYEWKNFLWYALYAWGSPAILTLCMALVNYMPGKHTRPGIGLMHCWFYNTNIQWSYMYSVMTILIIVNICIFIYTSIKLWRNTFATSRLAALKYKFGMTLRLFIVMGITWIFEMISSVTITSTFWAIIDIYNMLQGLMIFLMLVPFRRRVIKALYHRGWLEWMSGAVEKHLAVGQDDEQDVMEHTKDVPLEDTK